MNIFLINYKLKKILYKNYRNKFNNYNFQMNSKKLKIPIIKKFITCNNKYNNNKKLSMKSMKKINRFAKIMKIN